MIQSEYWGNKLGRWLVTVLNPTLHNLDYRESMTKKKIIWTSIGITVLGITTYVGYWLYGFWQVLQRMH